MFSYFPSSIAKALIAVSCLTFVAVYAQIYFLTVPIVERNAARDVQNELADLKHIYDDGGAETLKLRLSALIDLADETGALYALWDKTGEMVIGNSQEWPRELDFGGGWRANAPAAKHDGAAVKAGYSAVILDGGFQLLVGRDMSERTQLAALLRRSLVFSLGVVLLSAVLSGLFLASLFNKRMQAIADTTEDILRGDLSRRVPIPFSEDEFSSLGRSINLMLERIEELMNSTRIVTDSIAHHVRGALTRLKTRLEEVSEQIPDDSTKAEIAEPIDDLRDLLRILDGLLEIARADAGLSRDQMKVIDLNRLLGDLVEIYEPLAEQKDVGLSAQTSGEISVLAHEVLLAQALSNLIENAIKYANVGGTVDILALLGPMGPVVYVSDNGPGIPTDQRSRAIARFSRLGGAFGAGGVGLGLSIVAAVARLHGAEFLLEDNRPGLKASLHFPALSKRRRFWRPKSLRP